MSISPGHQHAEAEHAHCCDKRRAERFAKTSRGHRETGAKQQQSQKLWSRSQTFIIKRSLGTVFVSNGGRERCDIAKTPYAFPWLYQCKQNMRRLPCVVVGVRSGPERDTSRQRPLGRVSPISIFLSVLRHD